VSDAAPRRIRKDPGARRAELLTGARGVFAAVGYGESGLAEIAEAASVSKALVYHYFPNGRPELFVAVTEEVLGELAQRLRQAAKLPFSPEKRMEQVLAAMFGFFDDEPEAFRLLFRDPWASRDPAIEAAAVATRVQVASELAALLAASGRPVDELLAMSNGLLGYALANIELCLAGQLDAETAWRITCEHAA
jgi:AcrR family transcriptional regulator